MATALGALLTHSSSTAARARSIVPDRLPSSARPAPFRVPEIGFPICSRLLRRRMLRHEVANFGRVLGTLIGDMSSEALSTEDLSLLRHVSIVAAKRTFCGSRFAPIVQQVRGPVFQYLENCRAFEENFI
jgi:hypothetical protein